MPLSLTLSCDNLWVTGASPSLSLSLCVDVDQIRLVLVYSKQSKSS